MAIIKQLQLTVINCFEAFKRRLLRRTRLVDIAILILIMLIICKMYDIYQDAEKAAVKNALIEKYENPSNHTYTNH